MRTSADGLRRRLHVTLLRAATQGDGLPSLAPMLALVHWMRAVRRCERATALASLADLLTADPDLREQARAYTGRLLRTVRASSALSEAGVLPAHGFFAELRERLVARVLPSHRPPHDLGEVLRDVFAPMDAVWLLELDDAQLAGILRLLTPDDVLATSTLADAALRAIDLVAHRLAAAGDDPVLAGFDPDAIDFDSPFQAQAEQVLALTTALRARRGNPAAGDAAADGAGTDAHARVLLSQCHDAVTRLRRRAPKTGATLRMNYDLERVEDLVGRVVMLLDVVGPEPERAWTARAALFRRLALAQGEAELLLPLLRRASRLVTSEIVSHAGRTGEHYITRTRGEWGKMWLAAGGAGLVVACLAAIKVWLATLRSPPLIEAALYSANYALGFIAVQSVGLTIATKQPAMTAAALAASIDASRPRDSRPLVETIQCLVRSQIAAILGNCLVAVPAAYFLSRGFVLAFGGPVATVEKAHHLLAELDPLGGALPYAALTGVWLAVSGVVAGYGSNSVLARHVPLRIRRSEALARAIGHRGIEWLARTVETRTGAILGSVVLGILLGSTGTFGHLVGVPIDIRHVSFGSANFGLALATLGPEHVDVVRTIVGIAGIGALNLFVSFSLALTLAMRARGRRLRDLPKLLGELSWSGLTQLPSWLLPVGVTARPPTTDA